MRFSRHKNWQTGIDFLCEFNGKYFEEKLILLSHFNWPIWHIFQHALMLTEHRLSSNYRYRQRAPFYLTSTSSGHIKQCPFILSSQLLNLVSLIDLAKEAAACLDVLTLKQDFFLFPDPSVATGDEGCWQQNEWFIEKVKRKSKYLKKDGDTLFKIGFGPLDFPL